MLPILVVTFFVAAASGQTAVEPPVMPETVYPYPGPHPNFQPVNNVQVFSGCCNESSPCGPASTNRLINLTETILSLLNDQCQVQPQPSPIAGTPVDCADILDSGVTTSGRYAIYPGGNGDPFFVYCDMDTDGGGWTVFQRRENGVVDFYLDWLDYKYGFGSVLTEHWLGNEKIHRISAQKQYALRVDLEDSAREQRFANYSSFQLGDEASNYRLLVSGYSGDAGDSLSGHNNAPFSTRDRDNDAASSANCAQRYSGAWWYTDCHASNLNGLYLNGPHSSYANGINWSAWQGYHNSMTFTEMKIRPA